MTVIIETAVGNVGSILNMCRKMGIETIVSSDPEIVGKAGKIILPGVGTFDSGMRFLHQRGLAAVLSAAVIEKNVPILGICLGMQLFAKKSEEGTLPGLGWIDGRVERFKNDAVKVPHMGWNTLAIKGDSPLFKDLSDEHRFYFLHSYHFVTDSSEYQIAYTSYGYNFIAAVRHKNIFGVQFHPEKRHNCGLMLLKNFAELQC